MRKVTSEASRAFQDYTNFRSGNTRIEVISNGDDAVIMYLHGHAIAKEITTGPERGLYVRSAGWETSTTKERLNGLIGVHVVQKAGQWYLNGEIWEKSEEWTKVSKEN